MEHAPNANALEFLLTHNPRGRHYRFERRVEVRKGRVGYGWLCDGRAVSTQRGAPTEGMFR
eukprot:6202491-Pleurochrysis_carterae.AAC.2